MRLLHRGRRMAEARMRTTWRCVRTTKRFDNATGKTVVETEQVYVGPGRLHSATRQAQQLVEAGASVTLHGTLLSLPVGAAPAVRIGDEFECIAVDDPAEQHLVGLKVLVKALPTGEQTTADRYGVEREVAE
jgi:maltooligosyltrehalose synthase